MPSLVGKNPNFKGPKTHHAIIKEIKRQALKDKGRILSFKFIEGVVQLFFRYTGFARYYRKGNNFKIYNLGWFRPITARRKVAIQKKIKAMKKYRAKEKRKGIKQKAKLEENK